MVSASPVGNTVTLQFSALTATQEVDNFCIYGVTAPEKGKTPVTAIRDCAQYKGTVAWQDEKGNAVTIFEANKVYKAVISLTSAAEYTFPNSGKSLFTVPGAVSAEYNKTGDHTATVTATFNPITTATKAEVYADRDSVTVGTSKKYVVCTALLSGFTAGNTAGFNSADGEGYRVVADAIVTLDRVNPQVAARIATGFRSCRVLEHRRRTAAEAALNRVLAEPSLSRDSYEIISRIVRA